MSDVVKKTSTRRRSRISCVVVEKITTRRREGIGAVVEKNEESRRTFNKNSCDLLTAITHTEILCALYKTSKHLTRKQNHESKTVDVSMMYLQPYSPYRKLKKN